MTRTGRMMTYQSDIIYPISVLASDILMICIADVSTYVLAKILIFL